MHFVCAHTSFTITKMFLVEKQERKSGISKNVGALNETVQQKPRGSLFSLHNEQIEWGEVEIKEDSCLSI